MKKKVESVTEIEQNFVVERTPVPVGWEYKGGDKVKVFVHLDLEDISVMERAESAYKKLNSIMEGVSVPSDGCKAEEKMAYVADVIRRANACAKESIDAVFDYPVSDACWGNSSCISFGDTPDNSRFGRLMSFLLELYRPAIERMAGQVKEQSDSYVSEVLDAGDGQA